MNSTLPPDPYKLLGVAKDAKLPEIRSAHRKLVLKCHPDKVQDAALKAIKQDEFQKVQEAYELLSDDNKRLQYDEQVKLFELRKEMGRGGPTSRSDPFAYEVKTAEPRANSYGRPKVYSYPTTTARSNEDLYEEPRHMPRKSASNESASERKRAALREEERYREAAVRNQQEDDRMRQREKDRDSKKAHSEKKKSRDKDRRRGTEEKVRSRATYVEDDSSDEDYRASAARSSEKKSSRHRMEDDIRMREDASKAARDEALRAEAAARAAHDARSAIKEAPMTDKWSEHRDFAGKYMQAARRKVTGGDAEHPGLRRAETFAASATPAYNVRYAAPQPQFSDEDMPRRSAAVRKESRRSSETPAARPDKSSRRRSPPESDPYIVDAPAPTAAKKPTLQSYQSAPPVFTREVPSRSKTEYPRKEAGIPPLPRASTFQAGDRGRERASGSSKLRREVYSSEDEVEAPQYSQRYSHSPPRKAPEQQTRYIVENGRSVPLTSSRPYRSDLKNVDGGYIRERSESPGTPARPPMTRNPAINEQRPRTSTRSGSYYPAAEPEPIVLTARPKLTREGSGHRGSSRGAAGPAYFDNVQFRPKYGTDDVIYSSTPSHGVYETGRRGSESREYYQPQPRSNSGVYA